MWKELRENPRALMYAALMHLLLFLALILNLDWKTSHPDAGQGTVIKAEVVDSSKVQAEVNKLKQAQENKQHEEQKHQQALEHAAQQAEQRTTQEEQRLKALQQKQTVEQQRLQDLQQQRVQQQQTQLKEQAAAKLKLQQQAKADQIKQQKALADAQRAQQAAKQNTAADAKAKQAAAKQKLAADKQRQAALAAKQQAEAEHNLQQQLAAEEHAQQKAGQNTALVNQYIDGIKQAVQNNWLRPASSAPGLSCTVVVNLIPGGDVAGVRVVESSGDAAFDRSVENAVRKAAPLPLPPDPALFDSFRELRFVFKPEN